MEKMNSYFYFLHTVFKLNFKKVEKIFNFDKIFFTFRRMAVFIRQFLICLDTCITRNEFILQIFYGLVYFCNLKSSKNTNKFLFGLLYPLLNIFDR